MNIAIKKEDARKGILFPIQTVVCLAQGFHDAGDDFEEVAHDTVRGDVENGSFRVLVDGDDALGAFHAGNVLDGAGDAGSDVEVGRHGLAGLADLAGRIGPAGVDDRP